LGLAAAALVILISFLAGILVAIANVIAGLILGWAWFAVCSFAFGGRFLRFGAPVEPIAAAPIRAVEPMRSLADSPDAAKSPAHDAES